jgi:dTDP-4-dehydrorhamnose reductase
LVIRTSWVYAASGANFLRTVARLAAERDELRIIADQFGAPTSASSIADAVSSMVCRTESPVGLPEQFAAARGVVHLADDGVTSWHGFAVAIVEGLRARRMPIRANAIHAITSREFPTKAVRPANSRLDLSRLQQVFGLVTPSWQRALAHELDTLLRSPTGTR